MITLALLVILTITSNETIIYNKCKAQDFNGVSSTAFQRDKHNYAVKVNLTCDNYKSLSQFDKSIRRQYGNF